MMRRCDILLLIIIVKNVVEGVEHVKMILFQVATSCDAAKKGADIYVWRANMNQERNDHGYLKA